MMANKLRLANAPRSLLLLLSAGLAMLTAFFAVVRRAGRGGAALPAARQGSGGAAMAGRSSPHPARVPASPSSPALASTRLSTSFVVPIDFDYSRSTHANYQVPSAAAERARAHPEKFGQFADIRNQLDREYHGTYTRGRQAMQDELVAQVVERGTPHQPSPWIVFTAGAMGAGKSHTIRWMAQRDIFPLADIVHIDSDLFKTAFPEWPGYVARDPLSAGLHARQESGYLVEIAQEAALRHGKHVWVDGSLRDCEWYKTVFAHVRRAHPRYQIAILYVTANEEQVAARVRRRAELTGRHVPEAELRDSLLRVPRSVAALAPCAHFLAVIDNSGAEPQLSKWCERELCHFETDQWDEIRTRFGAGSGRSAMARARSEGAVALAGLGLGGRSSAGLGDAERIGLNTGSGLASANGGGGLGSSACGPTATCG